jgi:hypothetical protein
MLKYQQRLVRDYSAITDLLKYNLSHHRSKRHAETNPTSSYAPGYRIYQNLPWISQFSDNLIKRHIHVKIIEELFRYAPTL